MFQELTIAAQSVQSLATLLKSANGLANYNEIVAKVSEVNAKLMQANAVALASQEKQSIMAARIQELEQEIRQLSEWSASAEDYELAEFAEGLFAYTPRHATQPMQSRKKLCANCFDQRQQSILQQQRIEVGRKLSLACPRCKTTLQFFSYREA